jgi:hypothetical protein
LSPIDSPLSLTDSILGLIEPAQARSRWPRAYAEAATTRTAGRTSVAARSKKSYRHKPVFWRPSIRASAHEDVMAFTLIFDGDIVGNPFATTTPHGTPNAIAVGNVIERNEELAHRIDRLEAALLEARRRLAKTRATWNVPCFECDA